MRDADIKAPPVKRIMAATDRSESADRAVRWAANMATSYQAELLLFQVLLPVIQDGSDTSIAEANHNQAAEELRQFAEEIAGERGRARVVVGADPAVAILDAIEEEAVDVVVVGNVGMAGRKQFLLGNIPNRISHNARCAVIIINTAQMDGKTDAPGRPRWSSRDGAAPAGVEGQLLGRALRIGRVLVKAGVREMLKKAQAGDETVMRARASRLRSALEELGPTFAKLGQILSTRPDLLPSVFIEELSSLQDRVTPLTEAEVVSVMEQELGVPWEDVFGSIDPEPLAAGTIAQVHRATLEAGERVVVKVQRPTAEHNILLDLGLLEMFAQKIADRPAFRQVFDIPAVIRHLSESLRRELDFQQEAGNMERMREVLSPFPRLAVPKVYKEYSTSRLLVMEEVQGIPVRQAPPGRARTEAARQLLESFYRQVLVEGFFHADPHPGNMKWWNDKIYLLDLGMVGEVEPKVRELMLLLLLAFSQKDAAFLADVVLMLADEGQRTDETDREAFQEELGRLIAQYQNLSLNEVQLGPTLQEVTRISLRHNVRLPASLALAGKAFAQMQPVAVELDPTLDPFSVASSFVVRNTVQQMAAGLDPKKIFYEIQKARVRLSRLVEAIEGVTGARPGARLQVRFLGMEELEKTVSRASRLLSLALIVSGALVGTTVTALSDQVPRGVPVAMGIAGFVLAALLVADLMRRSR